MSCSDYAAQFNAVDTRLAADSIESLYGPGGDDQRAGAFSGASGRYSVSTSSSHCEGVGDSGKPLTMKYFRQPDGSYRPIVSRPAQSTSIRAMLMEAFQRIGQAIARMFTTSSHNGVKSCSTGAASVAQLHHSTPPPAESGATGPDCDTMRPSQGLDRLSPQHRKDIQLAGTAERVKTPLASSVDAIYGFTSVIADPNASPTDVWNSAKRAGSAVMKYAAYIKKFRSEEPVQSAEFRSALNRCLISARREERATVNPAMLKQEVTLSHVLNRKSPVRKALRAAWRNEDRLAADADPSDRTSMGMALGAEFLARTIETTLVHLAKNYGGAAAELKAVEKMKDLRQIDRKLRLES